MEKGVFILCLAICILFSLSSVCAGDVNDTAIASDDGQMELSSNSEMTEDNLQANDDETVGAETDLEILSADEGTYAELKTEIGDGGDKNLTKSYYRYEGGETIEITTPGIINGNGAVIDMAGSAVRAFKVSASGLTFKNLTIKNANYTGYGGAIYFDGQGTVTDCNFVNNTASDGGAVYFKGNSIVENCNFTGNTAVNGGAIFTSPSYGNVRGCVFANNSAFNGGAVSIYMGIIENCNFTNNNAANVGGAVKFSEESFLKDCNFTNNLATNAGGAVSMFDGNVENCNFINNKLTADDSCGGAIDTYYGTVSNCNFVNNTATYCGGAVYFDGDGTLTDCNFIKNKASTGSGAAVYCSRDGEVTNCNFTDNFAPYIGGAIYFDHGGNVLNCNFNNNRVGGYGGGAIAFEKTGNVANCSFTNNRANFGVGGAICFYQENSSVSDCIFVNNSAGNFSAVYLSPAGNIYGCIFINNSADYGIVGNSVDAQDTTVIANNIFLNNHVIMNVINFASNEKVNSDYNWFGNTADNYTEGVPSDTSNIWLFLNATAIPDTIPVLGLSNIIFKLYAYNKDSTNVSDYDNALLKPANLTITATNGDVDGTIILGNAVKYEATSIGKGSVTASIENVAYTIELTIKYNPNITVPPQEVYYGNSTLIALGYNSTATGTVNIILKGKKGNSYAFNNIALNTTITIGKINPDEYNVTVSYSGDDEFANVIVQGTFTVLPIVDLSAKITSDKDVYFIGDYAIWIIKIHNAANATNATGIVLEEFFPSQYFTYIGHFANIGSYNNESHEWDIEFMENGTNAILYIYARAKASGQDINNRVVVVCNETDWDIWNNFAYNYVDVEKLNSTVDVKDTVTDYGKATKVTVMTEGAIGITAKINGVNATVEGNTITIPILDVGTYTLTVTTVPDENHTAAAKNATITVNKLKTQLTASSITATYNVNKDLVITLKDANGNPLTGVKVTVNLNGAKTYTTDKNGQIKVATKKLAPKTYTVKMSFDGNANYAGSSAEAKVIVKKAKPKIIAKKKTYRAKAKVKKFTITLKDNLGKPIKKAKVSISVKKIAKKKAEKKTKTKKKKANTAKTNKKGKATFRIDRNKKGTYLVKIKYKGNKFYKVVTKKVKIKLK